MIIASGGLRSDAIMMANGGTQAAIGMSSIKQRRLRLPVTCHPGLTVGEFVPFYLCPRSIMLFVIHCKNHPELAYKGGQGPIVHLVADLHAVVRWATSQSQRWAFSLGNAGAAYTEFRNSWDALEEIDWASVEARDFRAQHVKEAKQAEFLVHQGFPWALVSSIGVRSAPISAQVHAALSATTHRPTVAVRPDWYY